MNTEKVKGHFWLYKGDERVIGLYGIFCQYTNEPKEYTLSNEQADIVLSNLKAKLTHVPSNDERLAFMDALVERAKTVSVEFDNVRAITVDGVLWKKYTSGWAERCSTD